MSDPRRLLLDENATDFERELLRSWQTEVPSKDARAKTLALLGLAAATGAGAAAAAASTKAGTASIVGGSIAPKAATVASAVSVKWVLVGFATLALAVVGGSYFASSSRPLVTPSALTGRAPIAANVPNPVASIPAATASASASASDATASSVAAPHPSNAVAPTARASSVASLPSSSLAEQIAVLDAARAALAAGDPAAALRTIAEYQTRFPRGSFAQEAEILRIDAMLRSGNRAGAESAAKRFLAAYPSSPHAPHLRALLEQAQ